MLLFEEGDIPFHDLWLQEKKGLRTKHHIRVFFPSNRKSGIFSIFLPFPSSSSLCQIQVRYSETRPPEIFFFKPDKQALHFLFQPTSHFSSSVRPYIFLAPPLSPPFPQNQNCKIASYFLPAAAFSPRGSPVCIFFFPHTVGRNIFREISPFFGTHADSLTCPK